jgi:peptide deformylase
MIYPIVVYGDPVLRQRAKDIEKGKDMKQLAEDMFDTMHAAKGVGLAAPQIGMAIRMFVADGSPIEGEEGMEDFKKVFLNPTILEERGTPWEYEEGCLSIPSIREFVQRKDTVRIQYYDENWNFHEEEYTGIKARIIQHEYDHIEGKLFIDYLPSLKKRLLKGRLGDISKGKIDTEYRISVPKNR